MTKKFVEVKNGVVTYQEFGTAPSREGLVEAPLAVSPGWLETAPAKFQAPAMPSKNWDDIRVERDRLLSKTDWTQLIDSPLGASQKAAWATYRQTLRDIPTQYPDPEAVVWPEEPA